MASLALRGPDDEEGQCTARRVAGYREIRRRSSVARTRRRVGVDFRQKVGNGRSPLSLGDKAMTTSWRHTPRRSGSPPSGRVTRRQLDGRGALFFWFQRLRW